MAAEPDAAACANCGRPKDEHASPNGHAEGAVLVCPGHVYQPEPASFGFYCAPCGVTHRLADTVRRHATLPKLPRLET